MKIKWSQNLSVLQYLFWPNFSRYIQIIVFKQHCPMIQIYGIAPPVLNNLWFSAFPLMLLAVQFFSFSHARTILVGIIFHFPFFYYGLLLLPCSSNTSFLFLCWGGSVLNPLWFSAFLLMLLAVQFFRFPY